VARTEATGRTVSDPPSSIPCPSAASAKIGDSPMPALRLAENDWKVGVSTDTDADSWPEAFSAGRNGTGPPGPATWYPAKLAGSK
jgi:hypothetical protein